MSHLQFGDTPPPDDDPELRKYRSSVSVPPWMRDEGGDQ